MNWLLRNRKLVLLGGLGLALSCCGFVGLIFGGVTGTLKNSFAYQEGLKRALAHPQTPSVLGTPIEVGWLVSGTIAKANDEGTADLTVPLEGPTRTAKVHIQAHTEGSAWKLDRVHVTPNGAPAFDAL